MFQGMFRKRGRCDKPSHEESNQIPAHQSRDAPRQLPLPTVRDFEQSEIVQQNKRGLATRLLNQVRYNNNNLMLTC